MQDQNQPPESEADKAKRMGIIEAFAAILSEKRKEAIDGRSASGIEAIWTEDQDQYDGRDEQTKDAWSKGRNMSDGLTETRKRAPTRSTVFLKITRPYVDAAAARVSDMLLPSDDRNWSIRPTPLPQMEKALGDARPVDQVIPQAVARKASGLNLSSLVGKMFGRDPQPQQAQPAQPQQPAPTVAEVAKQAMDKAMEKAEVAQTQIDDWLVECRYHAELRKLIDGSARLGTGVLKGPYPTNRKSRAVKQTPEGWVMEMVEEIKPESREISVWKLYPDPNCGTDIQKGSYVWEEDDLSARMLSALKDDPDYLAEMIDLCLEEGPCSVIDGTRKNKPGDKTKDRDMFQIWHFNGQVSKKDMEAAGCKCGERDFYPCVVSMVNARVIKVALSPLDSGQYPYDVMTWQARTDHWAGVGVSRQMRECQKGANAALRNMMDNAGISAGPMIIIDRSKVTAANGQLGVGPRKVYYTKDNVEGVDLRQAFVMVEVPSRQKELLEIIAFFLKEAEDVTGLPMLLQGQQGKAPDTLGGLTMMNNNATAVLRRIARTFDDRITDPHIGRYYEYLLLHGPDEAKGDFAIDVHASSSLVERDMQSQQLPQMLTAALQPAYGLDPELVMEEYLKAMKFDPKRMKLSDEKKAERAKQPPPVAPQVQAAQIREKGAMDREMVKLKAAAEQGDADRSIEQAMKSVDERLTMADLSAEERRDLGNHKVDLAKLTMQLNQQKDLSVADHTMDLHKHRNPAPVLTPPTEPTQRAEAGRAYEA